jgi:hypothetical protein
MWIDRSSCVIAIAVVASAVVFLREMPITSPILPVPENHGQALAHRTPASTPPQSHSTTTDAFAPQNHAALH